MKQNNDNTEQHKRGPCKRVIEATKLNAETGDPPSQDPRDHREQPFRHNGHPGTSKQTTTTPCRNESGEKLIKGETGGEAFLWSAPVAFRRVALETPEWTSRDSNHHRQSVSAGKTNAIPTEPSGRLKQKVRRDLM